MTKPMTRKEGKAKSLKTILSALAVVILAAPAFAQQWHTTSSLTGKSKYGDGFQHYDYVNPTAPKGGASNSTAVGTFDSFNPFIATGTPAAGLSYFGGLLWDTLMQQSVDEPSVSHPLIAEAFTYPDDFSSATYRLNAQAKWHDGQPITADDVIWSFNKLKEISPVYNKYYANVTEAVKLNDREVQFRFDQKGNRELPHVMGDLAVLPKHWWEATDANGKQRDIARPTLEIPLGSGAYQIESFKAGSEITWKLVPDYWAANIGVNVGRNNFERQRFVYFQDDTAAWEAFKKGGYEDLKQENRSARWAKEYTFPAFLAGDVLRKAFPTHSGEPMQAFFLNARRPQLADPRVREALGYAFDFETMNRTIFFDSYVRTSSYWQGQDDLASSGLPQGRELEILEQYKDKLPAAVFTTPYKPSLYDTPQAVRDNLRKAVDLLKQAGYVSRGGKMVNEKTGQQLKLEFLENDPSDERVDGPFAQNLRKLGIEATLRVVDTSQYVARINQFDYDIVSFVLNQSASPGNEQREYWGTKAADFPGSRNLSGIKDPVVDELIEKIIFATDRKELEALTKALDRVLLAGHYVVPQWHKAEVWMAWWNKFDMPEKQPEYTGVDTGSWWIDLDKEKALNAKYGGRN